MDPRHRSQRSFGSSTRAGAVPAWVWLLAGTAALLWLAYGSHVLRGGFYNDDWTETSFNVFADSWVGALDHTWSGYAHRPLFVLYDPLLHQLVGFRPWLLNLWSLVLALVLAGALHALLREVRVPAVPAAAVAVLTVLLPFSDSTRLWSAASHMSLSLALFCAGAIVALRALQRAGRRALLLHAASLVLYLASLALFEITAGFVLGAGLLYLLQGPRRAALRRWAVDVVAGGLWLALVTAGAESAYERSGLSGQIEQVGRIADQAWTLFAQAFWPFTDYRRDVATAIVLLLALGCAIAWRRATGAARSAAGTGLALLGAGLVVIMLGYLAFVPADPLAYKPSNPHGENRVNAAAAPGYALLLVATAVMLGALAQWALPHARRLVVVVPVLALAVLGAGLVHDAHERRAPWERSWAAQQDVLDRIEELVPRPPQDARFLTFGHPGAEQFGVPLLGGLADVTHALRLTYGDDTLGGAAVLQGSGLECGADEARVLRGSAAGFVAEYGETIAVDVSQGLRIDVRTRADCLRALETLQPGPVWRLLR